MPVSQPIFQSVAGTYGGYIILFAVILVNGATAFALTHFTKKRKLICGAAAGGGGAAGRVERAVRGPGRHLGPDRQGTRRAQGAPGRSRGDARASARDRPLSAARGPVVLAGRAWARWSRAPRGPAGSGVGDAVTLLPSGRGGPRALDRELWPDAGTERAGRPHRARARGAHARRRPSGQLARCRGGSLAALGGARRGARRSSQTRRGRSRAGAGSASISVRRRCMARVQPRGPIEPGGRGLARLVLERPIVARGGDRFVVRSYSPVTTIGGGRVLDPDPPRRRAAWPAALGGPSPAERLPALLERRPAGIATAALPVLLGLPPAEAEAVARAGTTSGWWAIAGCARPLLRELGARALASLKAYHRTHPSDRGMPLETLRHGLRAPEALVERALADAAAAGRLRLAERAWRCSRDSPPGRGRRRRDRPHGPHPGGGRSEPRRAWPSSSARPGGGTSRPFSGWRPRPAGSRRSSGSATTPGRRSSGSPPTWPTSAAAASSRRPRSATGWGSAASS